MADVARRTCCFVAGTLVMTESGLRPIEDIEVGDQVLSRNEETGETAFKPVTELIRRHDREIWEVELKVEDGSDVSERFETTDDHPWRTADHLWVLTASLTPGSYIERANGLLAVVVSIRDTASTAPTFNFEVADFHSYFVGQVGAWVHNENCILEAATKLPDGGGRAFEAAAKKLFAKKIVGEGEVLRDASGKVIGEVDFETAEALVEVGTSLGNKVGSAIQACRTGNATRQET